MNFRQAKYAMRVLRQAQITPHFIGHAGVGKSAGVYQFAAEENMDMVEVRVALMADAGDMIGLQEFIRNSEGLATSTKHILPEWFMKAAGQIEASAKVGREVVIFLDELSRGHKDLLQAAFELVYDRSLKGVKVRPGTFIVAASNPATDDYSGSMEFSDDAFQDRFCHIKLEPTTEEFFEYGRTIGNVDSVVLDFLGEMPKHLEPSDQKPWNLDFVKPSRRSWDRVSKIVKIIDANPQFKEVEAELVYGIVGEAAGIAFNKFRTSYVKALNAEQILNNYTSSESVRKSVLNALDKGQNDVVANMISELGTLVGKRTSITSEQADNLGEVVHDLTVEHAFSLVTDLFKNHSGVITKIEGQNEETGLFEHKRFCERFLQIKKERAKIKARAQENKTAMEKKKK